MDISRLHSGMLCATRKGPGWIMSIDQEHHSLHMKALRDKREFDVDIDEVLDDPQVHNPEDGYY
ncbi:hypothetical protein [Zobellella maritima]|uniref:hypothetical protein n=1 Tax=Zobellella maritima TaxID=2059725 RepID=UPI00130081A8|nr:hypothetical protein [Zobellella maritima]